MAAAPVPPGTPTTRTSKTAGTTATPATAASSEKTGGYWTFPLSPLPSEEEFLRAAAAGVPCFTFIPPSCPYEVFPDKQVKLRLFYRMANLQKVNVEVRSKQKAFTRILRPLYHSNGGISSTYIPHLGTYEGEDILTVKVAHRGGVGKENPKYDTEFRNMLLHSEINVSYEMPFPDFSDIAERYLGNGNDGTTLTENDEEPKTGGKSFEKEQPKPNETVESMSARKNNTVEGMSAEKNEAVENMSGVKKPRNKAPRKKAETIIKTALKSPCSSAENSNVPDDKNKQAKAAEVPEWVNDSDVQQLVADYIKQRDAARAQVEPIKLATVHPATPGNTPSASKEDGNPEAKPQPDSSIQSDQASDDGNASSDSNIELDLSEF